MNIVFFSPLANTSAIGRVTALIVPELTRLGHRVTIVRTERGGRLSLPPHPCGAATIDWNDESAVEAALHDADGLVYQIGNNYDFHCGGLYWLARRPGIVCLHDFVLAHLFAEWAESRRSEAEDVLKNWYDESIARSFFAAKDHREFLDAAGRDHPMTEWICSMAYGVISHSRWGMARVMRSCPGPVHVQPLPYDAPGADEAGAAGERAVGPMRILTVGHININKRIESVIEAIGRSDTLRGTVEYQLWGLIEPSYALDLARLARSVGVRLRIFGEVSDSRLQSALGAADILCCLRWPSLEAASATAIEGMLYGKAVVVTDTAFYAELPDDCVRKIDPRTEVAGLQAALEELASRSDMRGDLGRRAQEWASRTFRADAYAEKIVALTGSVSASTAVFQIAQGFGAMLKAWKASPELLTADEIAGPLALFQGPAPSIGNGVR